MSLLKASAAPLSQNDISILMPLPTSTNQNHLLQPATRGAFGELLPLEIYNKMPPIALEDPALTYQKLRVVGIRVDPCFALPPPAVGCQAQVRMVWQPVWPETETTFRATDGAIHSFYNLSPSEFSQLIADLEKLKSKQGVTTRDEALTVNPLLKQLGMDSDYAKELVSILLARTGASRLSQATFMHVDESEDAWIFGGFSIDRLQMSNLPIPRISGFTQTFNNKPLIFASNYYAHGSMVPAPQGKDTFNLLVSDSREISKVNEPEVIESVMSIVRIENPTMHNPQTMDCVSCHTAQPARVWANKQFPWLMLDLQAGSYLFRSKYNLTNTSPRQYNTRLLRAFGYGGTEPAISQRTVNETAAVLERLYPTKTSQ